MSAAFLPADHRDRAIAALSGLRDNLYRRAAEARKEARRHNDAKDFDAFEKAFGMQCAFAIAIDDVSQAIRDAREAR